MWLSHLGADIKGYALAPEGQTNLYNQIDGDRLCQSVIADIRDEHRLIKELIAYQPDIVVHLAAQPLVRRSYLQPVETWSTNVLGTVNVLEGIRQLNRECVGVMITTDKVYQNKNTPHLYNETDRLGGHDPYSASKAACELVIDSYRDSYFGRHHQSVAIASARAGNVIGGGDWAEDRLLPDLVRAWSTNQSVSIRNPNSVRPWQHVLEPLSGYLQLAIGLKQDPGRYATSWNLGPFPEDHFSVSDICRNAAEAWGSGRYTFDQSSAHPHETALLQLDIAKSETDLDWHPKLSAGDAIKMTMDWYKSVLSGADATAQCLRDIKRYETL